MWDSSVMVLIGDTRSRRLLRIAEQNGWGQIIQRGRLRGRRLARWAFDNGAFADHSSGRAFDSVAFAADLETIATMACPPMFIVAPDIVAGGVASLALSLEWASRCRAVGPTYLAVQDGMSEADVDAALDGFAGLFVGGSIEWKCRTGAAWVKFAHARGLACHIGRVGTARRVAWSIACEADSIDSCLPLWSAEKLASFRGALDQTSLGFEEPI